MAVAAVTAIVSAPPPPNPVTLALLTLSGGLACIGSVLLNHYFDRDIDCLMERTRGRPLPSGRITNVRLVFWRGLAVVIAGLAVSVLLNLMTTGLILAGAIVYVVLYTIWLRRRSPASTVVCGLSGSFAALPGWAAAGAHATPAPFLVALVVFLWTPPHFWSFALANRADYQQAGVPMVPGQAAAGYVTGSTGLILLRSAAAFFSGAPFGWVYPGATAILGSVFLAAEERLLFDNSRRQAWRGYKFSGIYLAGLFVALVYEGLTKLN